MELNKIEALKIYKQYFNDDDFENFLKSPYIDEEPDDFENYYPEGTPNLFSKEGLSQLFTAYKLSEDLISVTIKSK